METNQNERNLRTEKKNSIKVKRQKIWGRRDCEESGGRKTSNKILSLSEGYNSIQVRSQVKVLVLIVR